MNKVFLIGNLASNPETRKLPDGTVRCSFRLAVQREYKNAQTGEREADFISITAWRKLGELCQTYLSKGKKAAVVGRLLTRSYEGEDGGKRYITEVVADSVEFLSPKGDAASWGEGDTPEFRDDAADYGYIPGEDAQLPF